MVPTTKPTRAPIAPRRAWQPLWRPWPVRAKAVIARTHSGVLVSRAKAVIAHTPSGVLVPRTVNPPQHVLVTKTVRVQLPCDDDYKGWAQTFLDKKRARTHSLPVMGLASSSDSGRLRGRASALAGIPEESGAGASVLAGIPEGLPRAPPTPAWASTCEVYTVTDDLNICLLYTSDAADE